MRDRPCRDRQTQPARSHPRAEVRLSRWGSARRIRDHTALSGRILTGRGGVDLPWRDLRPRVRALLMLLAMNHGRQLHREQIIDALWPDATLASGIRSLQVAVSSIRQCLSAGGITEDALRRHGDAYALRAAGGV